MGSALYIPLFGPLKSGNSVEVKIVYKTTKGSTALQWLDKEHVVTFSVYSLQTYTFFKGKHKGRPFHFCLVSVNQYMLALLLHCKVGDGLLISKWKANIFLDTPSVKIVGCEVSLAGNIFQYQFFTEIFC